MENREMIWKIGIFPSVSQKKVRPLQPHSEIIDNKDVDKD